MQTEEKEPISQARFDEMYHYARHLFMMGKNSEEVKNSLLARDLDEENADLIINLLLQDATDQKKAKANKDMLYGGLWFAGGLILTLAHIGFIFWGAILFGGIQFFRGVSNL